MPLLGVARDSTHLIMLNSKIEFALTISDIGPKCDNNLLLQMRESQERMRLQPWFLNILAKVKHRKQGQLCR